jgi:hypothetical protein
VDSSTLDGDGGVPDAGNTPDTTGTYLDAATAVAASPAYDELVARDTIAGLRAELDTLKARLELLETTEVAVAFARVDQLEEEREARVHELHRMMQDHRNELRTVRKDMASINESAEKAIASMKQSTTWKIGSVVITPLSRITGRLPR